MDIDKLADLPTPALITLGFVLAVIMGVRFLGLWQGERSPPASSTNAAQVAAVIVDPTALNAATAAVKDLTRALDNTNEQLEELAKEMLIQREINRRN
jgi:hypothetical protein